MNCTGTGSIIRDNATRGFFALFYDWSVMTSAGARPLRSLHTRCRFPGPAVRHLRRQKCQYSSSRTSAKDGDATQNFFSVKEPPLAFHLRSIMRKIPHSVVVATSTAPSSDRVTPASFRGMTVSSFTTLTLTPSPIVTFNIRQPSQTLTAIQESKQFLIHILSATESGARVADVFTRGNGTGSDAFHNSAFSVLRRQGAETSQSVDPPLLAADGIIRVLRCELMADKGLVEVGDHVIILGKVVGIIEPSGAQTLHDAEQRGLCYLDRAYREAGSIIELPKSDQNTTV